MNDSSDPLVVLISSQNFAELLIKTLSWKNVKLKQLTKELCVLKTLYVSFRE